MSIVKILRIVDCNGEGLYRSYTGDGITLAKYVFSTASEVDFYYHPTPSDDMGLYELVGYDFAFSNYSKWKFGFEHQLQFMRWVYDPQWRKDMEDLGGKLVVITIDEQSIRRGSYQVIYDPEKVIESRSFSPACFDNKELRLEIEEYLNN